MKNRKHILVVDDVTTNLRCIGEVLREEYSLSMSKSGDQALKTLERIIPDLILLDVKMPEMDGYEILSHIKCDDRLKDIPVIFLSADTSPESITRGMQLGAIDYIRKPFEPGDMISRIENALKEG